MVSEDRGLQNVFVIAIYHAQVASLFFLSLSPAKSLLGRNDQNGPLVVLACILLASYVVKFVGIILCSRPPLLPVTAESLQSSIFF